MKTGITFITEHEMREKIISLARECGVFEVQYPHPGNLKEIEAFYQRVRNEALEEAAVRADAYAYMSQNFTALSEEIREMKSEP